LAFLSVLHIVRLHNNDLPVYAIQSCRGQWDQVTTPPLAAPADSLHKVMMFTLCTLQISLNHLTATTDCPTHCVQPLRDTGRRG